MKTICTVLCAGVLGLAFAPPAAATNAVTFREKVLHSFSGGGTDGANPAAGVIKANGLLYGTTVNGSGDGFRGTVFAVDRKTGAETVVYSFCSRKNCEDGFNPWGGVIDVKGKLYGTTIGGGSGFAGQQYGTAFALDLNTGAQRTLYAFCQRQNCPDGAYPEAGLTDVHGTLYGTTHSGGMDDLAGAVFALDKKTGAETVVHSFCSQDQCTDGAEPGTPMINVNGTLYGTTLVGGYAACTGNDPPGCGTVFSFDPATGAETVIHAFGKGKDGQFPEAGLFATNGVLYGTTGYGGTAGCFGDLGCGTVFSVDLSSGTEKVLYAFCSLANCTDGAAPFASPVEMNGILYGTTQAGGGTGCGGSGCGTVFSFDPGTGAETVLHSFCSQPNCTDGANPEGGLIAVKGKLYGTTYGGGAYGYGTVFVLEPKN